MYAMHRQQAAAAVAGQAMGMVTGAVLPVSTGAQAAVIGRGGAVRDVPGVQQAQCQQWREVQLRLHTRARCC